MMVHEQPGGQDTQVLAGEADRSEQRMAQGAGQCLDPGIAEAQRQGPPSRTQSEGPTRQTPSADDRARRAGEGPPSRSSWSPATRNWPTGGTRFPPASKRVGPVVSSWSAQRRRSCPRRG